MFANYHNFSFPFDVDHKIEAKLKVSWPEGEFFVSLDCELICRIDIVINLLEKLEESVESIFRQVVFHVLNKVFNIFSLFRIAVELVS